MARTINEIDRALRRLEATFERGFTAAPNPVPGAVPEAMALGPDGAPSAEAAQVIGLGMSVFLPPGCNVLIARVKHGQDPVVLSGTGTPVAIKAVQALAVRFAAQAGGVVIADPVAGTSAIVLTPAGTHVVLAGVTVNLSALTPALTAWTAALAAALNTVASIPISDPPTAAQVSALFSTLGTTLGPANAALIAALVA